MKRISVALVEDNQDIRSGLKLLINNSEFLSCEYDFSNAEDAISYLTEHAVDIVLMDIDLPGMNGIEAIAVLKCTCPDTQFMMLTSYEDDEKIFSSLQIGATGYLLKKSATMQIAQSLIDLHQGGSPMSPGIARKVLNAFNNQPQVVKPNYEGLSPREQEIINCLAEGFRYNDIAEKLFISPETVRSHIRNIYQKLEVQSRTDALNKIFKR